MSLKLEFAVQLGPRLDQIERCLVLAETVANVLQSDSHLEHDSIVRMLGAEAIARLGGLDADTATLGRYTTPTPRQLHALKSQSGWRA